MPPKKPSPIADGPLRAYAHRPPLEGDTRWAWRVCYHDGPKQRAVRGAGGRLTPPEVRALLRELLRRGGWEQSAEEEAEPEEEQTIGLLLDLWLDDCRRRRDRGRLAEGSVVAYEGARSRCKGLDSLPVDAPDLGAIQAWIDALEDDEYSPRSILGAWQAVRIAWRWGRSRQYVPALDLPQPELPPPGAVYNTSTPTLEEALRAHACLSGWHRALADLLLGTGARIGELAALRWEDCRGGVLQLDGKTGERKIRLGAQTAGALNGWWEGVGRPAEGRLWPVRAVKQAWAGALERACAQAGVPVYTPHGLRRLASTRLIAGGADPVSYAAVMGHSHRIGLQIYAQAVEERVDAAAALLDPGAGTVVSLDSERRRRG